MSEENETDGGVHGFGNATIPADPVVGVNDEDLPPNDGPNEPTEGEPGETEDKPDPHDPHTPMPEDFKVISVEYPGQVFARASGPARAVIETPDGERRTVTGEQAGLTPTEE